jgi:hypothetical protein
MYQSKYLPKVPNYGFANPDFPLPIHTVEPRPIQLHDTDWLDGLMSQAAPNIVMPDIVRVHWGAGDKAVVGELYKILSDKPTQLTGVSKESARHYLNKWELPEDPAAQTADWFENYFASKAMDPNPVAILSGSAGAQ